MIQVVALFVLCNTQARNNHYKTAGSHPKFGFNHADL